MLEMKNDLFQMSIEDLLIKLVDLQAQLNISKRNFEFEYADMLLDDIRLVNKELKRRGV
ncbi:hypothetical protein [Halalkalibacter krulwichiae]|uniref:Uncharacterized protein n=1 Tax=Halalkalibacter krulwichiae TaxID=199441 RepID=A0A1X9MFB8_9BACI|nr:hypothetical protein [Halalkalibacter krulwichiae]ARK32147.1 hypothetical protein BkAM31D_21140 [Halalkalibacter krulwichiae]